MILVTGGAGFIGSNLVEELVRRGADVVVVDNFHTGSIENLKGVINKIRLIKAPCSKLPEFDLKVDTIFHFGIPSSSPMYKENPVLVGEAVSDFMKVFELAKSNEANVVYASTSSLYGMCPPPHREDLSIIPFDFYTEARLAMERLAKVYHLLSGVSSVGLRFFSVYGPHEEAKGKYANLLTQFIWAIGKGEAPEIYGDGNQARDFIHVHDVVNVCIRASELDNCCEVVNVGSGKATTFNHVVELINKELRKNIQPKYLPNPIKNYVYHTCADLTKARRLLGFEPTIGVEEGIKLQVKKLRSP